MKKVPRLTDDALFYGTFIVGTIAVILLILEMTGLVDDFIQSFN